MLQWPEEIRDHRQRLSARSKHERFQVIRHTDDRCVEFVALHMANPPSLSQLVNEPVVTAEAEPDARFKHQWLSCLRQVEQKRVRATADVLQVADGQVTDDPGYLGIGLL